MEKRVFWSVVSCLVSVLVLAHSKPTHAANGLVWETTFNCSEWNQSMGLSDSTVCSALDGLAGYGAWTTAGHPNGDEITLAANNPGGAGGRGFRHWRADGVNANGGGVRVTLPGVYPELWFRFYMRYQAGFAWSTLNYTKELYVDAGSSGAFTVGFHSSDAFGIGTNSPSRNMIGAPGWTTVNRGTVGDGNWHCYEAHVKLDTNGSNGIAEAWVDGVQSAAVRDADYGATVGWSYFAIGENQASPNNGGDRYTDFDDVAVSATGLIGCGPAGAIPAAPQNVRVLR